MGIANDLKRIAMLGRFAPKPLANLALFIIILQCLYNKQAIAKPRPEQYLTKEQWTGNVLEGDDRHWSDLSIERSINERDKRSAVDKDDTLEGQKGFKVLTASNDKREGIQTPIEALKSEGTSLENTHEQNSRSNVNEPNGGSVGSTNAVRQNSENNYQQNSATTSSINEEKTSGSGSNSGNVAGEKRGEVTLSSQKAEESKSQSNNVVNNANTKQDNGASSATSNNSDKAKNNNNQSTSSPKPQDSPSSVTIQGNTINGQPISSSSSSSNSEVVKDPVGNSGSEVVTSHPNYENDAENSRFPYRDARSKEGSKGSSEPEVGHFQVDDKSADLEINANSAGVKVKAKPASLQVVSRPGAHPPTPIVPIAPMHPYYHHHPHFDPYGIGFRRSRRPYHRRLYDNPYHAHYRAWIPPPNHHYRTYFDDPEDVPFYRRGFNPYHYGYHHRHHHRHHRYPMPELYDRSEVEDMYHYPMYRRRFRGPYRRGMYGRRRFGMYDMPESRFHIPRRPREFARHDIVTPVPPPVNVYGNPPPGILKGEAANMFGMSGMSGMRGMSGMNAFNGMPGMSAFGMGGLGMNGPLMPGMNGPGLNGLGMNAPGMFGMMGMNDQLGSQEQFNGITRSLGPRNDYSEPRFHVKKAAIQGTHKKNHVKGKTPSKKKTKDTAKKRTKIFKHSKLLNSTVIHAGNSTTKIRHRSRRSVESKPKRKTVKKLRPQKNKEQKGNRKNSIVIHRPPIIYHPPPEIYHRPDIVVHRAPIMLHRPSIIYHQPPVVVHRPAIIYHQPSIVFHQPPPVVHQPIMHSHDTYVTRPMVLHSGSMVSHPTNYLGIPNHVYSDYDGFHGDYHEGFHGDAFRKHSVPHDVKTVRAEIQGKIFKKSETSEQDNPLRPKRDIYTKYLDNLDYLSQYWKPKVKRHVKDDFDVISSKEASSEALTYKDAEPTVLDKRNNIPRYHSFLDQILNTKTSRKKRDIDADDLGDDDSPRFIRRKKKKDVVVNRPPIIYHPPPEVYHRPDIVVHRPPLVIHRPPIIYHQPPVIVHRPAVVYHQPPIVFHQPPPAVSQPLLFSHDSFTIHPSFYATHHGSVVRDYGHYIGIPNIVSNYGAPLFHSGMGKRSKISKPAKKKSAKKSSSEKPTKKSKLHHKKEKTENPHKKNSVVIRRPPIIYHPPPEIYHRPDIVVHRAPIMIHRAPIVYHQPPVVVHRPAIVYHQPSLVFHQPPPAVHQPLITSHDTWVTHSVPVPISSHVTRHTAFVGIPKHAYMNFHDHWGGDDNEHAYYKSKVPKNVKGAQRDNISKTKKHTVKKSLKHKHVKEEKAKKKNSVMIKRPPIIYHPPPEVFHRPDIVVHRPPILVHRAPIVYHQPPVIVHRPPIVYHQPNIVFHQPMPMVHQPIMQSHDTWVTRPAIKLYGSTVHHLGAVTQYPNAYYNGHHNHLHYMAYGKSKVPSKEEKPAARDEIKHDKASEHDGEDVENSGDDNDDNDDNEIVESGSGSAYGELDIEVVPEDNTKSKLHKAKPRTESASKKDKISKISPEKQQETTVKGSKKNSVVIHRPPIIYHPPPEIYHRPDIVVHRAPIVLYRAPIIYHQPPVVVHRPAIVYHQPSIVFHQPPPMVHQQIMHSHDNYVTHSVAVPVGSHVTHAMNYHGVPHEEIYMEGIGHGAFAKSVLPLRKGHKRDKIKSANVAKDKDPVKASKRSRRALEEDYFSFGASENPMDVKQPIGASERIRRAVEQSWISNLDSTRMHAKELNKRNKESVKKRKPSKKKKKDVVVSRPPIIYHPPPEVYHRPEIVVHRAPILIHRPPIVYHQPPVVVHRPAVVYHQPPIVFHQPPPSVNQPLLFSHDQFVLHPTSVAQHINSVVNEGGHYIGLPNGGIENYPGPLLTHQFGQMVPALAPYHVKRGKVQRPNDMDSRNDTSSSEQEQNEDEVSGEGSGEEIPSRRAKTEKNKPSKGQRKNNVLVYRPPMIYHPPPEIYDRPDIVVHRPDLVIHRPSIVYHQPSVVIHRPPIVYQQPPVMFHQPPPLNHQPIVNSHDTYVAHRYFEPHSSFIQHAGSYVGAPHFYPGANSYGWGMQGFRGPFAADPGFGLPFSSAFGRSAVQKVSKKNSKEKKKAHVEKASKKSKHGKIRHKRSNKHHHHHWHHKDLKRHAYHVFDPVYTLMEQHESFITDPLSKNYLGEISPVAGEPAYTKSRVAAKRKSKRSTKENAKRKEVKKHKKGARKNMIMVHRPPMIYHPPPEIYDRPDVVVHRPDIVIHRPSVVYHQPSVVVHRPPIIYHEPPVVFHQPSPMVHHPIVHSHDTYVGHPFYEPYASHIEHAGSYVGAPHFFGGGFGYGYDGPGFGPGIGPSFGPGFGHGFGPAFGKSKIEKGNKKSKKRSRRSAETQKKASKTGSKKNMVLIQRPPMIYHPPPEIYDRPNVIVHRPDLVIHRPSIVYHQPSVVIHRPPVIYQQPPVVFHQPPPLNTQPILHAHDSYIAHTYHEPIASSLHHAGTYVGAPHYYPGGWGIAPHTWGPAFGKSKVPKAKSKGKKVNRGTKTAKQRSRRDVEDKSKKIEKKTKTSKSSKGTVPGHKKNLVVMRRPPVVYHPPPEVYHRPDVILHRPDIVIHRPSVVFHQSAVVIHRPPVVYHQPPLVFHQPTPMVHQPILHSHETYLPHHFYEPAGAHVVHAGTYVGAPHFYHGGWGWGYGYHAGHAFGKSKVEDTANGETSRKAKPLKNTNQKDKKEDDDEEDDDDDDDDDDADEESKTTKSKNKSRRSLKTVSKSHKKGHKKNIVVMRRPPVVYHPPSEVYHRPDVVLHRPDIVIHRPSVVFHQSPVVIHRPSVVYHQPPIVFHQPSPMVHQPMIHSHDTYLAHHFYEPFHAHVVHAGTYVGAPHFFGGGWGWGYGHGHGHAFGKSKVEKAKNSHHHKTKRATTEDKHPMIRIFQKFLQKRSVKGSKKDNPAHPSHKPSKKSVNGTKKNMVLIQRPPMIYHPPPEIYDRPNIVVHRPDLVYHQPSIVYHQSSVVVHRAPVIYHPPPVVFHQPSPLVHQNVLHSHDSYIAHRFYEPYASHISHGQTYVGAPHFFGGGWGYGYGLHGPLMPPVAPNAFGLGPAMFHGPFMYNGAGFHGAGFNGAGFHGAGFHGPMPFNVNGPAGFHHGFAPQAVRPFGPAFAKSDVERPKGKATKKSHKAKHARKSRSLSSENKNSNRVKSRSRHHKGLKKNVVVMHRPPIMFHPPPEVYHRPDLVIHRPDVVIHRPSIVLHQAPVVVHKPAVVYHQSPVVLHQPPPFVHQPVLYSHDSYVPHTYYEPFGSAVANSGTYVGAPHGFDGGWGYGYGHVVGGFGKSTVEKNKSSKSKKAHKGTKKSKTVKTQENASKKVNILHPEVKKDVKAEKKNDIVVNRPPIIYHPPPEVYHRPDIVVHRAPIVVHRPPIIYHQPPVVVHRPAVVYHQPPIVFHQPPPAVHQPIIHSHDTFVVHHTAMYEPHGSTVSHQTNYIGIPSHVEHFDEGFDYHGGHEGYHDDFIQGYHGYHGGFHGGYHGYRMLHRSNIEHAKKSDMEVDLPSEESSSTKSTITKTEMPVKKENTHTVITDEDQRSKTITKRQILGSHSLFLPVSPLNVAHPKGPIVERLQKMSTIPGFPMADYEHHVAKRDLDSQKEKRQLLVNPGVQAPVNYVNLNALTPQRFIQPLAGHVATPLVASAPTLYPRLPFYQPLLQAPFYPGYPPVRPPGVNVHVETERSAIPDKKKKRGGRQRRQVLPVMQPDVFGNVPHLLYNQAPLAPLAPLAHEAAPQLPQQMASPFLGYHPMMFPSYPLMNYLPQRRPHVNINVQSMRSSIPKSKRKKKSVTKRRSKRQLLPQMINPYALALNYLARGYGPYNPYWNMNMNPLFFRRSPEIPNDDDGDESDPESQNVDLIKQYLTDLYEYYTGEKFNHKRPKVDVEVHASKSNIPGSSASNIVVRSKRQMFSYLPQSPLTTGRYDIPISGPLSSFLPLKRSKVNKPKRSLKKDADKKTKRKEIKGSNSKRDEFAPQSLEGKTEQSNLIQLNPDNPGASLLGNEQNNQFSRADDGAEGMNEIGPGGLNGAIGEPQEQQSQTKAFFEGNTPREAQNRELQQEFMQQQQDLPVAGFRANNEEQVPNFPQFQEMQGQGQNRMELPMNEEQMLRIRGQVPFFPPGPQIPLGQKPLLMPGPSRAFFLSPPVVPPHPVPFLRPFAPLPFAPVPAQQVPLPFPMQYPMASFFPEQQQQQQGTINVNVNTAKSKLPRVKGKKKTTEELNKTEKQAVPSANEIKSGDKRQRISLFQRIPAMQVLPQRFLQNGVAVPSFAGSEPRKESEIHGVNGMVISELQMQRKHAIPSKINTKNIQAGSKKSDLSSNDVKNSQKTEVKSKKAKRQIYGMNELPQEIKYPKDQNSSKKFHIKRDKEQEKKVQKRYLEILKSEKANGSSKSSSKTKTSKNAQHVGISEKKSSLSKITNLGHRKRQFVMPFGVERAQAVVPNMGIVAEQGTQEQVPQVINQYQQEPQQVEQVFSPQQTHVIQEPEAAYGEPVQQVGQIEEPLNHVQSYANEINHASVPGAAYLGHRPKVQVSVQVAKSSIGKGTKAALQDKKATNSKKDKTITKRQLFGTVPLFSPLGRADVNNIVKAYVPDSQGVAKQQQVPVVSRRSLKNQMHERQDNSKTTNTKQKRQLGDLINNILERRRGPKLLGNLLKKPKENPPIMFTTGNGNNNDEKPIDVFPGSPGGNQNPGEGQPRPADGGVGNPFAGLLPPPPSPLQTNQNPLLTNPAMPANQGMYQDDQSAIAAAQAANQPPPLPLLRQQEPDTRQNVLQFLQNAGLPNPLIQQRMNLEPQMPAAPFLPPVLPLGMPPPPIMPQPPMNDAAENSPAEGRSQTPFAQSPPGFQFPLQGGPQMGPFAMGAPPVFPMMPFNGAQAPFFQFPSVPPEIKPVPGVPGNPFNHLFDKLDDERPSVSVNVQTSKSKIPKTDKS